MKKFFNCKIFMLVAIFMLPLLLLTACEKVEYFNVEVLTSDISRGSAIGPNQQVAQGRTVEIAATPSAGEFVCWVKNSNRVVSTLDHYSFEVNAQTAGTYTAVFSQSLPGQMMYAALTGVNIESSLASNFKMTVSLIPITSSEPQTIFNGDLQDSHSDTLFNGTVFSFRDDDDFLIDLSLEFFVEDLQTETCSMQISRSSQDWKDGKIEIVGKGSYNSNITLTFEKLSQDLVKGL